MKKKFTTILIDMYGVILEESKGRFIPYTFEYFKETEHERLVRQFREEQLFTKAGNGEISSNTFLSLLGYDDPEYHMKNYIENYLTLDKDFIPFAEKYYKEYDFVLLSNDVSEWSAYITEYYHLNKYFQHKIVSGDVKCRKPEKEIYELALEKIGQIGMYDAEAFLPASKIRFIGNLRIPPNKYAELFGNSLLIGCREDFYTSKHTKQSMTLEELLKSKNMSIFSF